MAVTQLADWQGCSVHYTAIPLQPAGPLAWQQRLADLPRTTSIIVFVWSIYSTSPLVSVDASFITTGSEPGDVSGTPSLTTELTIMFIERLQHEHGSFNSIHQVKPGAVALLTWGRGQWDIPRVFEWDQF